MESSTFNIQVYDLTGKVSVVDGIAKFNGNYSSVLLGAFNGDYVAIKVIKAVNGQKTSSVQRKLRREVVVWGSMSHPNIHPFYGVAYDQAFGPFGALISPWCSNGDASQYMSQNGPNMVMAARINLWKGVIEGFVYLHGCNPPIIHGDLKPGNILIDDSGKPRICDFGLARIFDNVSSTGMTTTSEHTGTTRYLAPELVASEESVSPTPSSDLYALGCLGLEFIYLQSPFSPRPSNPRGHLMILQDLRRGLVPANALPHRNWPSHRVWPLISALWNPDPLARPTAFMTSQRVRRTVLTLPPNVIQRVVALVDANYDRSSWLNKLEWKDRTQRLLSLSLVSRAYCGWTTPALYRHIRLPGDLTTATFFLLLDSLNNSIVAPLSFNQVHDGYGMYTETLVVGTTRNEELRGHLSTGFRDIMYMMPMLRLVRIGEEYETRRLGPLTTLEVEYRGRRMFLMDPIAILQAFSYLQRLRIDIRTYIVPKEPLFTATSSSICLPCLEAIEIRNDMEGDSLSSAVFLDAFSGWRLPSLQQLFILSECETDYIEALVGFLWRHGNRLRFLTLFYHGLDLASISPDTLADIFALCTNLQSIEAYLEYLPKFNHFPSHPSLQQLKITFYGTEDGGADEYEGNAGFYKPFRSFRPLVKSLFPKLIMARFKEGMTDSEALFRSGDDYITVMTGTGVTRHYDEGVEIGEISFTPTDVEIG